MISAPHTIICGLGSVGYRILRFLEKLPEIDINVITLKTHPDWEDNLTRSRVNLILDDARKEDRLILAGVINAKCIVIATDSDATNLSIAFDAVRLNPPIRIVLRLQHEGLAKHVKEHIANIDIWNPDSLATPLFVRASMGEKIVGELSLAHSLYLIEEVDLSEAAKENIKLSRFICVLNQTNQVTGLTETDLTELNKSRKALVLKPFLTSETGHFKRRRGQLSLLSELLGIIDEFFGNFFHQIKHASRRVKHLSAAILLVFFGSVLVFTWFLKLSVIDAVYFVTTIMTTVGFGDFNLRLAPDWLKIYGCFLMVYSVLIVAGLISLINNALISSRLRKLIGPRPSTDKPHIIVSGVGPLGYRIVKSLLSLGQNVFAISDGSKDSFHEQLRDIIPVIQSREFDSESLSQAYISQAKAVVICSSNEIRNLTEGLSAKKANHKARVIVRTLDEQLAKKMDISLPIDKVLSDSEFSATNFVASIFHQGVLIGIEWERHFLVIKSRCDDKSSIPLNIQGKKLFLNIQKLRDS